MSYYMVKFYIHSLKIVTNLILSLNNLSASNDFSMHLQGKSRNDTQGFVQTKISFIENCLHPINFNYTPHFPTSSALVTKLGTSNEVPLDEGWNIITCKTNHFSNVSSYSSAVSSQSIKWRCFDQFLRNPLFQIFYGAIVEWTKSAQTQHADCPQLHRNVRQQNPGNDHTIIHCNAYATNRHNWLWIDWNNGIIWIWKAATDYSSKLERFELAAQSIQYPSNNGGRKPYSTRSWQKLQPQSPEPSQPSPILTPPKNLSTIERWETPHTTTDNNTFYCDDEPRRSYFCTFQSFPQLRPRKLKKTEPWNVPPKKRESVAAELRGLYTVAPKSDGHTRLVVNQLRTQDSKLHTHTLLYFQYLGINPIRIYVFHANET